MSCAPLNDRSGLSGFPAVRVVTDDGLVWDEIEVPSCTRRASISDGDGTQPGPTTASTWIMLSRCADAGNSHLVGLYDSGESLRGTRPAFRNRANRATSK